MSQPKEKKARTQRETGSSPSFPHPTRSEDTTETISGPACVSAERDMEVAHPPPVQAVVLARASRNENKGTVLIARRGYKKFRDIDIDEVVEVTKAEHLADAAKARAREEYDDWKFVGPAVVYDYNPTNKPLEQLTLSAEFDLQLRDGRPELGNNTPLHGFRDPETQEVVNTFFVLVTAFERPQAAQMQVTPAFGQDTITSATDRAHIAETLVNELMKQEIVSGGFLKVDVAAAVALLGIRQPPVDEILYRPAYRVLFELINADYDRVVQVEKRKEREKQVFVSVTGTPGIGKSTMLLIFLLEYLRMGKTVAFFRDEEPGIPAIPLIFRWDKVRKSVSVEVGKVYDSNIVTLTDSSGPGTAFMGLVIWAHSPGAEEGTSAAKQFSKEASSVFALPLWTDNEVATVHERWKVPESADDLSFNQSLWGNVPRQIFRSSEDALRRMRALLKSLRTHPEASILTHLSIAHREGSGKGIRDRLMLMHVSTDPQVPDDYYRPGIRLCTPFVYGELLDMLSENVDQAQRRLMELFSAVPEAGGALGNLFEAFAHRYVSREEHEYKLAAVPNELMREVYDTDGRIIEPQREVVIKPLEREFFPNIKTLRTQLQGLQEEKEEHVQLRASVYYQPWKRNQAAVDSFLRVGNIIYMFQFTVSPSHDVHTGGLNEVFSLVPEDPDLVYVFVFCVPQHVHDSFQMGALNNSTNERALQQVQGRARRVLYYKTALPFDAGADTARH